MADIVRPAGAADEPRPVGADVLQRRVESAQVAILFRHARLSTLTAAPVAWLVCFVLSRDAHRAGLLAWAGAMSVIAVLRAIQGWRFARRERGDELRWRRQFAAMLVIEAAAWSLLGTALLPPDSRRELQALVLATLVGVGSVGAFVLQAHFPTNRAFVTLAILPAALVQFAHGDLIGLYAGTALVIYLVVILLESSRAEARTLELLRLRYTMDALAADRAQALKLVERRSAVKSQFLATMSHEMRTPLHGLLGLTRMLQEQVRATDAGIEAGRTLSLVEQAGEHLLTLINDVLDLAKLEAGQVRLTPRPFDLAALVDEVAALSRPAANEAGLALHADGVADGPVWVVGDARRVRQVLQNLVGNAIKFTDAGSITVRLTTELPGRVRIEVRDTGIGIAAADLQRIFDSFHQVEGTFDRRFGGTGLGLTISRELARAMGGELDCQSSPGQGSCFRLLLPLRQVPPPAPPAASEASAVASDALDRVARHASLGTTPGAAGPGSAFEDSRPPAPRLSGRVLLAEDNPVNAVLAEATLRRCGLEVEVVTDGASALAAFQARRPDLVLMDCQMPAMDGFEATMRIREHEMRQRLRPAAIVALTANAFETDRRRCLESGMDDYLAKPFRSAALVELLQRYLPPSAPPASAP